jgi:hypothetical protein
MIRNSNKAFCDLARATYGNNKRYRSFEAAVVALEK